MNERTNERTDETERTDYRKKDQNDRTDKEQCLANHRSNQMHVAGTNRVITSMIVHERVAIGFSSDKPDWMTKWREILKLITRRSNLGLQSKENASYFRQKSSNNVRHKYHVSSFV